MRFAPFLLSLALLSQAASTPLGGSANAAYVPPRFIALGDSITSDITAPGKMWPQHLARLTGWALVNNAAVSGSTLSSGKGSQFPLVESYAASLPNNFAGHVVVLAGTNDYKLQKVLGRAGETDPTTVYGSLMVIGRGVLTRTQAQLHLCTPLWRGDTGYAEGIKRGPAGYPAYALSDVRQAVRYTAKQLAREFPGRVQLLDSGIDLWWEMQNPRYINSDLLHPTAAGQRKIAEYFAGHLWGVPANKTGTTASKTGGVKPKALPAGVSGASR